MIRFPSRSRLAPSTALAAIGGRRLRARPLALCFQDVHAAQLTNPSIALLDLLTHVPGTAADLPFVHAGIAAEGASRAHHKAAAPAADRLASGVPVRFSPFLSRDAAASPRTHARHIGASAEL
jgi:hypothetical protein